VGNTDMGYAKANKLDQSMIPIVDITSLRDNTDPVKVAKELHKASKNLGFIYIKGHGIPEEVIEKTRSTAYKFFKKPDKTKSLTKISSKHRGWLGQGGAKMKDNAKADLKESFIWGHEEKNENTIGDHPLRGTNRWPSDDLSLQKISMEYFQYAHQVAYHLMRGFALGLNLKENFFIKKSERPLSRASYVYYPAQPSDMGESQFGVGPHTDFGVLTVLCQDAVGGLQVQGINGEWIHAPPIKGSLIVNVADLLSRWTDGAYKSTPHRVVNTSGKERLSIVLAFDPDPETVIDSRDVFGIGHNPKEEPITCGDYLVWRFEKAFSYRKK
jgi:isopenicillin N synthase-like dioxygenase